MLAATLLLPAALAQLPGVPTEEYGVQKNTQHDETGGGTPAPPEPRPAKARIHPRPPPSMRIASARRTPELQLS